MQMKMISLVSLHVIIMRAQFKRLMYAVAVKHTFIFVQFIIYMTIQNTQKQLYNPSGHNGNCSYIYLLLYSTSAKGL